MKFLYSIVLITFWIQSAMSYSTNGGCSVQLQCKYGDAHCTASEDHTTTTCGATAGSTEVRFCKVEGNNFREPTFLCCDKQGNAVFAATEEVARLKCGIQ